jgi:hypothetical protein
VFWPTLRDNVTVAGVPLGMTLRQVARHARTLGRQARRVERQAEETRADETRTDE